MPMSLPAGEGGSRSLGSEITVNEAAPPQHSRDPADPTVKMVIEHESMSLRALRAASRRVRTPTDVDHRRFFLLPDERLETNRTAAATQRLGKIG